MANGTGEKFAGGASGRGFEFLKRRIKKEKKEERKGGKERFFFIFLEVLEHEDVTLILL